MFDFARFNYRKLTLGALVLGAILYYLPFLSREFMGDDWLWLYNAKRALSDPSVYFQRPMYGYLRPLNMMIVSLWYSIFGVQAWIFSLINVVLHGLNVYLMFKVLQRLGASIVLSFATCFFFAFYYLACPAIEWISVGHDLWVTALTFLFILGMIRLVETPGVGVFLFCLFAGFLSVLIKESGFITLGFYFAILILYRVNPFSKKYLPYTISITVIYIAYLIIYALTRTVADKEVAIGPNVLINTWYFFAYMAFPLSERILTLFPGNWIIILKVFRFMVISAAPIIIIFTALRGSRALKVFVLWSIMAISTIAIFNWHLKLLDLVPESTASRFMYYGLPGLAIIVGWIVEKTGLAIKSIKLKWVMAAIAALGFIIANHMIIKKVSQEYFYSQGVSQNTIASLSGLKEEIINADLVTIVLDSIPSNPYVNQSPQHLRAIAKIKLDLDLKFTAISADSLTIPENEIASRVVLKWDSSIMRFRRLSLN